MATAFNLINVEPDVAPYDRQTVGSVGSLLGFHAYVGRVCMSLKEGSERKGCLQG